MYPEEDMPSLTGSALSLGGQKEYIGGQINRRNYSTREMLQMKKDRLQQQISEIDKILSLLDTMPNIEELLTLLPRVGL